LAAPNGHADSPELADEELLRMYCDGDIDAFDTLFDRHHVPVYNFARFILGDALGAEEIMQDTFLAVARGAAVRSSLVVSTSASVRPPRGGIAGPEYARCPRNPLTAGKAAYGLGLRCW